MGKKKDDIDELLEDIDETDDDDDKLDIEEEPEEIKTLKEQIAALEKKNMGLLNETKSQRRKRQQTEERLDKLTDTVENILSQKKEVDTSGVKPKGSTKVVLDYDDDGNPVLEVDKLPLGDGELKERIANLEALLQASVQQQQNTEDSNRVIQAIVGEDERYGSAYNKYQNARKWVEDKVVEFQEENNIQGFMSSGQALDHVFGEDLEDEFKKTFPAMDLERVVTAEDSQRHFRNTLAHIAGASESQSADDVEAGNRFKKVLAKPSNLGGAANQKGADLTVVERLSNLTSEDIIGLNDADVARIERALARESK
jgi:hypothetical protein